MKVSIQKIGPAMSALVIGSLSLFTALQLNINQVCSDFIVGYIAWFAESKFQDLVTWP